MHKKEKPKINDLIRVIKDFGNDIGYVCDIKNDKICIKFHNYNRPDTWQWYNYKRARKRCDGWWIK